MGTFLNDVMWCSLVNTVFFCGLLHYLAFPLILLTKYRIADADDGSLGLLGKLDWIHTALVAGIFWLPWLLMSSVSFTLGFLVLIASLAAALYVFHVVVNPKLPPALANKRLQGKTVLIVGGNRGVGLGTAIEFALRGCRLVVTARSQEKAEQALTQIKQATGGATVHVEALQMDLSSKKSVEEAAAEYQRRFDRLDVLLLNAGIGHRDAAEGEDGIDSIISVNLLGPARLLRLLLPLLQKAEDPVAIMTSSVVGRVYFSEFEDAEDWLYRWMEPNGETLVCYGGYGRSKALQMLFIEGAARKHPGVRLYTMHPGTVSTDMPLTIWGELKKFYPEKIHRWMYPVFAHALRLSWMNPRVSGRIPLHAVFNPSIPSGAMLCAAPLTTYVGTVAKSQAEHADRIYAKVMDYLES